MEERTFKMDFDARKEYVKDAIAEVLTNDTDTFVNVCEELDNWDGFLGDARCYDMYEIDEFLPKSSDLLDKMNDDFNKDDEYFYFDTWGVSTSSDKYDVYSDEVDVDDIIAAIEDCYNHINISNGTLDALCEILYDEDFGIDEDFDEEDFDEDDVEDYESDEEFKQRIANIM